MEKLMTKKNILLVVSGSVSIGIVAIEYVGTYVLCDYFLTNGHQGDCPLVFANIELVFFSILPLFFFSLITYFMKEEVFQSWYNFVRIYIPFSIILVLFAPSYNSNWMFPYDKGMAAFFAAASFTVISAIVIFVLRFRKK